MTGVGEGATKPRIPIRVGEIASGGIRFRYREAGAGPVLLCIGGSESFSPMRERLAQRYRVVELQPLDTQLTATALALSGAVTALGIERFDLLSHGASAILALGFALDRPKDVRALVLLGPTVFDSNGQPAPEVDAAVIGRLGELMLPNLAIFGTKDPIAPAEAGRHYRARIPGCNLMFVYDAGHAMETERPDAVAALVFDFLDRHDLFLVRRESDLIYP